MAQGFDLEKSAVIDDGDLVDPELTTTYFVAIVVECFGMLGKVPESVDTLRVQIQTELLNVVRNTTRQLMIQQEADEAMNAQPNNYSAIVAAKTVAYPLLSLLEIIFKQLKAIAKTHALVLKNYLAVVQKYSVVGPQPYDMTDFWSQAQSVVSNNHYCFIF